jgi:hypothetical protein
MCGYHGNVLNERMYVSENEKEGKKERESEGGREKEGERKRSAEINIRPRAPTVGLAAAAGGCFPRERTQLALACYMNDGALSHLLPREKDEDERSLHTAGP